jgi:hypothetical protein
MSEGRRGMFARAIIEMFMVAIGVFLGLAAEQWRSDRQHREQAHASLQRFKTEIEANKAAVEAVADYHAKAREAIRLYLDPKTRDTSRVQLTGIQPVNYQHTAWDLAIATQSLADLDPHIAYELARIYGHQSLVIGLTTGLTQAMYLRPPTEQIIPFLHSVRVYYDDLVIHEPALLKMYAQVLPQIEEALRD